MDQKKEEIIKIPDSPIYFLGLCDKYHQIIVARQGVYEMRRADLIGLRNFYTSVLFPFQSESFYLLFLFDNNCVTETRLKLKIRKIESKEDIGLIEASTEVQGGGHRFHSRFTLTSVKIPGSYSEPGIYQIVLDKNDIEIIIGEFDLIYTPALPLTPERIKALKSDPKAAKYIKTELSCSFCRSSIKAIAGIEKKKDDFKDGSIWYTELPDNFICSCGKVNRSLRYWKESLHGLLGYKPSPFSTEEEIERNYTRAALEKITTEFKELIDSKKGEEEIQKFIENNPIVLSLFSPELLKFKAPATAKYKTDFALYNQKGELVLIEIEKSSTPLFTQEGVQHSKLTQSISQVENWLSEARRNKLGLIDDLNIKGLGIDMIHKIKGVVVAGRSLPEYDLHIGKIHARTDFDFYTYDDLYNYLKKITQQIQDI